MKPYGQWCTVAKALEVVGDRWSLLIVRELLIRGACRFTDLKQGLPGIAPNLLSSRLTEFEQVGLVVHEQAEAPIATALYRLTDSGRALEPVLRELALWGLRFAEPGAAAGGTEHFRAHWMTWPVEWFLVDTQPDLGPLEVQLLPAGEAAVLTVDSGEITVRPGSSPGARIVLGGDPVHILMFLQGASTAADAAQLELSVEGDLEPLRRIGPRHDPDVAASLAAGTAAR